MQELNNTEQAPEVVDPEAGLSNYQKKIYRAKKHNDALPAYYGLSNTEGRTQWWTAKLTAKNKELDELDARHQGIVDAYKESGRVFSDADQRLLQVFNDTDKKRIENAFRKKYGRSKYWPH